MENQIISINLVPNLSTPAVVRVSQYDVGRPLVFKVYDGTSPADLTGVTAVIEGTKRSGLGFSESGTVSDNTVTLDTTLAMTQEDGNIPAEIRFSKTGEDVGTANFILAVEKTPHAEGTTDGTTETMADLQSQLDALDTRVEALEEGGGGGGLTEAVKSAMLQIAQKVAYIDEHGQTYYDALYNALYPPASLVRISAVYTQSGTVYDTDTLDSLRSDLVVTAHMSDRTTRTVTDYTLSGTLTVGTSTVTASYGGKTTTFSVTVSHATQTYVTDGLVARWDGIDNTGNGHDSSATTWKDLVGSYDIAVPNGSATWDEDGLVLTGAQSRNVKSSSVWSSMSNTTIEIVFTPTDSSTSVVATFDMHNSGAYSKGIDLYSDNTIGFVGQSSTTFANAVSSLTNINQVACLYNGDSVTKALVNGVVLELSANTHSLRHNVSYIMVGNSDSGTAYLFKGKIRAIRVYNRQLTDAELAQNLSADRDRFSL